MTHAVLIVDDEPPARAKIARLLAAHADFRVVGQAGDVAEAVLGGFQDPEGLDPALLRWEDVPPVLVGEDVCRGKNH